MLRSTLIGLTLLMIAGSALAAENESPAPASVNLGAAPVAVAAVEPALRRPAALTGLYGSFIGLQVLDARTTAGALARGAREANPLMRQGNRAGVWAVKAASTASTIYFTERLWKKNRLAAILVMAGINGGYAVVAAHNLKQGR